MKKLLYFTMLLICTSIVVVSCKHKENHEHETEAETSLGAEKADLAMNAEYQCPMDCEEGKTYDKEGQCPKCKMDLKKMDKDKESHDKSDNDEGKTENHDEHEGHDHD